MQRYSLQHFQFHLQISLKLQMKLQMKFRILLHGRRQCSRAQLRIEAAAAEDKRQNYPLTARLTMAAHWARVQN